MKKMKGCEKMILLRMLLMLLLFTEVDVGMGMKQTSESANGVCYLKNSEPVKNKFPFSLCHLHPDASCCLPIHDEEIEEHYHNLVYAGQSCAKHASSAKDYLRALFCLGCSPQQPLWLGPPVHPQLFSVDTVVRVCKSVADVIHPNEFSDCGMKVVAERGNVCAGDESVVPRRFWQDCQQGEYVCYDNTEGRWSCSPTQCEPENIPLGFAPNISCSDQYGTCNGTYQFLNDNRGAKPPFFEDFPVEIVNKAECKREIGNDSELCNCMTYSSSAFTLMHGAIVMSVWGGIFVYLFFSMT